MYVSFSQYEERIVKYILLTILILLPSVLVFLKDYKGASIIGAVAAAAILFTRLRDISSFRLLGLAATLERQREQVEITLAQLQGLSASLARASFSELAFSGQVFVGISMAERFRVHDEIVANLMEIGLKSDDIMKTQRLWVYVYCDILAALIQGAIKQLLPATDVENEFKLLHKEKEGPRLPSPGTLRKWADSKNLSDTKIDRLLQEYENVWTTGTMKNPDLIPYGAGPRSPESQELPTSPKGLKPGDCWNNGGTLSTVPPGPQPQ
jgi:hypothetical protein